MKYARYLAPLLILFLASCAAMEKGAIRASEIEGLLGRMVARHDAYVAAKFDAQEITEEQKADYLGQSARLMAAVQNAVENVVYADAIRDDLEAVADRHDAYVIGDETISAERKRIYLEVTSGLLREIVEEAGG